jgi:hypothetical protein
MYKYAFRSNFGYNTSVREGKIYFFSSKISMFYLLSVNRDLVNISYHIREFCNIIYKKKFLKKIIHFVALHKRDLVELGLTTWNKEINKKLNEIKDGDNLNNYLFYILYNK